LVKTLEKLYEPSPGALYFCSLRTTQGAPSNLLGQWLLSF
jgi:hypothetical protein